MGGRAKFYGKKAFEEGKRLEHNPFRGRRTPEDMVNEMDWEKGWITARDAVTLPPQPSPNCDTPGETPLPSQPDCA